MSKHLIAVCLFGLLMVPSISYGKQATAALDVSHARMMVQMLRAVATRPLTPAEIDQVMAAEGTRMIVAQQNISRSVSLAQYRILLQNLHLQVVPEIAPVDQSERASRGVDGLRNDVWAGLRWGVANVDLLAARIAELEEKDVAAEARTLAQSFLPRPVDIRMRIRVVAGGRAGASVVEDDALILDVLAISHNAVRAGSNFAVDTSLFAHEMHHAGLAQIVDDAQQNLRRTESDRRVLFVLRFLALEGSATYLISAQRNIAAFGDPAGGAGLIAATEQILSGALDGTLVGDGFERALTPMTSQGFHIAGAVMFGAIDRAGGLSAVLKVLEDIRTLPAAYAAAAASLGDTRLHSFNAQLASRLRSVGE